MATAASTVTASAAARARGASSDRQVLTFRSIDLGMALPTAALLAAPSPCRRNRPYLRVAHHDPHCAPAGHLRHRVELADDQGAAAVGLDDVALIASGAVGLLALTVCTLWKVPQALYAAAYPIHGCRPVPN
jgi:hypothetical protein